jgi:hypothetical protein
MARSVTGRHTAAPLPEWIRPQLTQLVDQPPDGPDWLHEIKFDGYRMHARLDHGAVRLLTRTGLDWTHKYPAIAVAVSSIGATQAYLDGELCGVRPDGITSTHARAHASGSNGHDASFGIGENQAAAKQASVLFSNLHRIGRLIGHDPDPRLKRQDCSATANAPRLARGLASSCSPLSLSARGQEGRGHERNFFLTAVRVYASQAHSNWEERWQTRHSRVGNGARYVVPPQRDVGAALAALSEEDLLRFRAIARLHARSLPDGMSWSDLIPPRARLTLLLALIAVTLPVPWARSQDRVTEARLDRLERQLSVLQRQMSQIFNINAGLGSTADIEKRVDGLEEKMRELTERQKGE